MLDNVNFHRLSLWKVILSEEIEGARLDTALLNFISLINTDYITRHNITVVITVINNNDKITYL